MLKKLVCAPNVVFRCAVTTQPPETFKPAQASLGYQNLEKLGESVKIIAWLL